MRQGKVFQRVAMPAMLAALSLVVLYLASLAPSGRWGLAALAGIAPGLAVVSGGLASGFLTYGAAALLGLLLVPDKGLALLFLLLFGLYPPLKSLMERPKNRLAQYGCKLVYFNVVLTVFCLVLSGLFMPMLPDLLQNALWLCYLGGNAVFLAYDFGLTKLLWFYAQRIDKAISK